MPRYVGAASLLATLALLSGCTSDQPLPLASNQAKASPVRTPILSLATGQHGAPRSWVNLTGPMQPAFEQAVKAAGGTIERRHPEINAVTITGLSSAGVAALAARADVEHIGPDLKVQWVPTLPQAERGRIQLTGHRAPGNGQFDQSGAYFFDHYQWNMKKIRAPEGWARTPAGLGVEVCVLDTGIDPGHIDLQGRVDLEHSTSFVESEPFIEDLDFHGTFVSTLISSNGLGIASVAPGATLCMVKVLDQTGSGSFGDMVAGMLYAAELGVDVINMSLGALLDLSDPDQRALFQALNRVANFVNRRGVLIVAAAGNDGLNLDRSGRTKNVPSQLDNVVSVGATGPINQQNFDRLASYSNYGRTGVDIVAPGGEYIENQTVLEDLIMSACSEFVCGDVDFYVFADGTSFSAPHAAGAAAVIESNYRRDQRPGLLGACLEIGADNIGPAVFFGHGRVDVPREARCNATW
jgi:subtilisin family serine protease